jgi:hypothetical protein
MADGCGGGDPAMATLADLYCDGPILAAVQRANLWPDCKDFVDTPLKPGATPMKVLKAGAYTRPLLSST